MINHNLAQQWCMIKDCEIGLLYLEILIQDRLFSRPAEPTTLILMPKLKTRRAAAKRFRRSGSGKIMRRKAFKSHLLERKNQDRKRKLSKMAKVHETDAPNVELMMPYL